jgi:hypothetical protein
VTKSQTRTVIAEQNVDLIFDDTRIRALAIDHKLPTAADLNVLGIGTREAVRIFAREVRIQNANELHDEVSKLHNLANRKLFEPLSAALEKLSPEARELLNSLPSPDALRDVEQREAACEAVAALCRYGGRFIPGRLRPGGKRSCPTFQPFLYAPTPRRHFAKRGAERNFVMWLQIAWLEATGKMPPRTARNPDRSRALGPFARFAKECLKLAGAGHANVVELINELERQRAYMEAAMEAARVKKQLSDINP